MLQVRGYQLELVGQGHNKYYRGCHLSLSGGKSTTYCLTQWGARGTAGQTKVARYASRSTSDPSTLWAKKCQKGYEEVVWLDFVVDDLPEQLRLGPLSAEHRDSFNKAWEHAWRMHESVFVGQMAELPDERPSVVVGIRRLFDDAAARPWLAEALAKLTGPRSRASNGDIVCALGPQAAGRLQSRFFEEVSLLGHVGEATATALVETTAMVWQPRSSGNPLADAAVALESAHAVLSC